MKRAVEMLGGGILGFIAGSFLCAPLIAHVFSSTVTWDASACPAGIYTITSTATNVESGRAFTTTTQHIRLPQPAIVQEFTSLPVGQYSVVAVARDARGTTFTSDPQSIAGSGGSRGKQPSTESSGYVSAPAATAVRTGTVTAPRSAETTPGVVSSRNYARRN